MSSTNINGYVTSVDNLGYPDELYNSEFLRLDGTNNMIGNLNMNNNLIKNVLNAVDSLDAINKQYLISQLGLYILSNSPVIFSNFNFNNFRATNMGNVISLSDGANAFYVQSQNALKLSLSGGIMTGAIDMNNNKISNLSLVPIASGDASSKNYVDSGLSAKVNINGSSLMTGNLDLNNFRVISSANPVNPYDLCTLQYTQFLCTQRLSLNGGSLFGSVNMQNAYKLFNVIDPTNAQDIATKNYTDNTITNSLIPYVLTSTLSLYALLTDLNIYLKLSGGTMSGILNMGTKRIENMGVCVSANDSTTKNYVDTADNLKYDKTGGTISSNVLIQGALTIGTTAINTYPLEITTGTSTNFTTGYQMVITGDAVVIPTLTASISLKTSNSIWSASRFIVSSDRRIKKDIYILDNPTSTQIIKKIDACGYKMIDGIDRFEYGYIAQQVASHLPECVDIHEQGEIKDFMTIDYKQINVVLLSCIQDLIKRIEILEKKLII